MTDFRSKANLIWQIADDILRGAFKAHEYGDTMLPFVVLRRLDCVLEPHREVVQEEHKRFSGRLEAHQLERVVSNKNWNESGLKFHNVSDFSLERLAQDAQNIELNFTAYLNGFSQNVRDIIEYFDLPSIGGKLASHNLLFMMCDTLSGVDLHPDTVSNHEMGMIFEELLRRFSEMSNETAGEHYTPREVIQLMVRLLFAEHREELGGRGIVRSIFDPACGTGGMLTTAKDHMKELNPDADAVLFGQEINDQTYAIAKSDFLISGEEPGNIRRGSSFSNDKFRGNRFDFMFSNPPFGVSWKKERAFINNEAEDPNGRFSAGTPRVSDGALLFLQHMISKMEPRGSRIAIVFNGSPLFTGDAGSGESDIRKWIIENDWLEAIVALPTEMFFNTGIATYIWIVTNRKPEHRRGTVQLVDASSFFTKMRKSLGNKRNFISAQQIEQIVDLYTSFEEGEHVRLFDNEDFGYAKVRVERPQRKKDGTVKRTKAGDPKPDTALRDYERVPLTEDVDDYFEREVLPHVPDAWIDDSYSRVGYEINFTRYFYQYEGLRSVEEITKDILALDAETEGMLREVLAV